jgi:hypothetical protein
MRKSARYPPFKNILQERQQPVGAATTCGSGNNLWERRPRRDDAW